MIVFGNARCRLLLSSCARLAAFQEVQIVLDDAEETSDAEAHADLQYLYENSSHHVTLARV